MMTLNEKLISAIFDSKKITACEFSNAARGSDSVAFDGIEFRGITAGKPTDYKKRDNPLNPTEGWIMICDATEARSVYEDDDLFQLLADKGIKL